MTLPIVALAKRLFSKIEPPKTTAQETTKMSVTAAPLANLTSLIAEANSAHEKIRQFAITRRQHRQALQNQAQGLLAQIKQADADVASAEAIVGSTAGATPVATPHVAAAAAVAQPAPAPVVSTSHNGSQG